MAGQHEWNGRVWVPMQFGKHTFLTYNGALLHRQVWIEANGKVPDGMTVAFVNGDELDCRLENLVLKPANARRTYALPERPPIPEPEPKKRHGGGGNLRREDGSKLLAPDNVFAGIIASMFAGIIASMDEYNVRGGDWKGTHHPPGRPPPESELDINMPEHHERIGERLFGGIDSPLRDPETGEVLTPHERWAIRRKAMLDATRPEREAREKERLTAAAQLRYNKWSVMPPPEKTGDKDKDASARQQWRHNKFMAKKRLEAITGQPAEVREAVVPKPLPVSVRKRKWVEANRERVNEVARESKRRRHEEAVGMLMDGCPTPIPIPLDASKEEREDIKKQNRARYHEWWQKNHAVHLSEYRKMRRVCGLTDSKGRVQHGEEKGQEAVLQGEGTAPADQVVDGEPRLQAPRQADGRGAEGTSPCPPQDLGGQESRVCPTAGKGTEEEK